MSSSRSLIFVIAFSPVAIVSGEIGTGCVDGIDCSPPMGWRSWNTFGGDVSQDLMINVMDAMTDTSRDGVSFASLGNLFKKLTLKLFYNKIICLKKFFFFNNLKL